PRDAGSRDPPPLLRGGGPARPPPTRRAVDDRGRSPSPGDRGGGVRRPGDPRSSRPPAGLGERTGGDPVGPPALPGPGHPPATAGLVAGRLRAELRYPRPRILAGSGGAPRRRPGGPAQGPPRPAGPRAQPGPSES